MKNTPIKSCITVIGVLAASCTISMAERDSNRGQGERNRPNPAKIFERLDQDSSGSISKSEFLAGKRAQSNPEMAAKIFDKLDADSSGEISRDEFANRSNAGNRRGQGEGRQPGQRQGNRPERS